MPSGNRGNMAGLFLDTGNTKPLKIRQVDHLLTFFFYAFRSEVNSVKNKLDSLFFTRLFVPRTSQISLYPTRETAFAAFSCGSSNVNVLGMEINMAYKIMVIDDEQMILDMLRNQFEMEQYYVITAKSAAEAIGKYSLETYDVNAFTRILFESLDKRIMNLSPAIKKEYKKLYVAYKLDTNFVDIVFQKQRLRRLAETNEGGFALCNRNRYLICRPKFEEYLLKLMKNPSKEAEVLNL